MQSILMQQEEFLVHYDKIRNLEIKVSVLNKNDIIVDELHGVVQNGNININNSGSVRRSCTISMICKDNSYLLGENKRVWIDKRIKIEIGIYSIRTDEVVWFNKGCYVINSPSIKYDAQTKTLDFEGLDYMCLLDGRLAGTLPNKVTIDAGFDISDIIQTTAISLGKVNPSKVNIERINKPLPYDVEKNSGETVFSILEEIKNLYMNYELFFDEEGVLRFQKIKNRLNDPVLLEFEEDDNNKITSYSVDYDKENIKNTVVIWGYTDETTKLQIHKEKSNTDVNSPFNVNKIGEVVLPISDDKIFDDEQADIRCDYELFIHGNMNDKLSFNCVPFYFLDVNKLVSFNISAIELYGKFLIDSISIPLGQGEMSVTAHRVYN